MEVVAKLIEPLLMLFLMVFLLERVMWGLASVAMFIQGAKDEL